ncbi:hypothetical protein [Faecalimonas umbilicata]|uniref:hypothetical protein n=1 Tax=Faecalimonas umbilicata TaxID=1912855 RepID=UPI00399255E5
MLKMVDGTGIIGVDMVCPLGGTVSPPQPPNFDKVEVEGVGSLMLPNSLKAPLERVELIGNSTQGENPTPDNPQEIKSAGRKSKNLFNKNTAKQGYEFPSAGSDVEALKEGWFVSDFMPVKATTYYISGKATGNGCKLYNKDKVFVKNVQASFGNIKFDEGIAYFRINGEIKDLDKIQVEERIVATDYEPYGYLLDVKVTGKNLLSNKPTDWQIGKRISWSGYPEGAITIYPVAKNAVNVISLKPSTTYSIINNSGGIVINRIVERGSSENGIKDHDVRSSKYTFVTNQNTMNAILQFEKVDGTELLSTDIEFIKIMLVEGEVNEPTPYEPYTEQTLTLTSDRPITKWDKLVEQGGQYGWLYQSEVKAYRGETAVSPYKSGFYFLLNNKKITKGEGYCSELKQDVPYEKNPCINFNMESNTYAYTLNTQEIYGSSVSEIKEYLKIHPLHLVYKTETTEFVPLPQSEQTQLRNLHSYNGTTHITVDSGEIPCGIKLTYRKEK